MSSSIVQSLVRAAASIPQDITDKELDKYVAELLSREAKEKEVKWKEYGLSAYLEGSTAGSGQTGPDPSLPKPNKRFLSSIIRTVDDHNTALLREQAVAARLAISQLDSGPKSSSSGSMAEGSRERRLDRELVKGRDSSRQAGGKDDSRAGAMRMFGGAMSGLGTRNVPGLPADLDRPSNRTGRRRDMDHPPVEESGHHDRQQRSPAASERQAPRSPLRREVSRDHDVQQQRRQRSPQGSTRRQRDSEDETRHRQDRDVQGSSRRPEPMRDEREAIERHRGRGRSETDDGGRRDGSARMMTSRRVSERDRKNDQREGESSGPHRVRDRGSSRSPSTHAHRSSKRSRSERLTSDIESEEPFIDTTSTAPGPTSIPSKMDHYFSPTYDPARDFSAVLPVPKTGLVQDVGWDNMLRSLEERGKRHRVRVDALEESWRERDPHAESRKSERSERKAMRSSKRRSRSPEDSRAKRSRRRSLSPNADSDHDYASESEGTRRKRKRKERKREERARAEGAESTGSMVYAKQGAREWDKGKMDPT